MKWKWIEAIKYEPHNLKFPIQIWLKLSAKSRIVFYPEDCEQQQQQREQKQ